MEIWDNLSCPQQGNYNLIWISGHIWSEGLVWHVIVMRDIETQPSLQNTFIFSSLLVFSDHFVPATSYQQSRWKLRRFCPWTEVTSTKGLLWDCLFHTISTHWISISRNFPAGKFGARLCLTRRVKQLFARILKLHALHLNMWYYNGSGGFLSKIVSDCFHVATDQTSKKRRLKQFRMFETILPDIWRYLIWNSRIARQFKILILLHKFTNCLIFCPKSSSHISDRSLAPCVWLLLLYLGPLFPPCLPKLLHRLVVKISILRRVILMDPFLFPVLFRDRLSNCSL